MSFHRLILTVLRRGKRPFLEGGGRRAVFGSDKTVDSVDSLPCCPINLISMVKSMKRNSSWRFYG